MSRRRDITREGFVLEADGRAILAFYADDLEHARDLCTRPWFAEELATFRSDGRPLWDKNRRLSLRRVGVAEDAELQIALTAEIARGEYEGTIFAFFVPIDASLQ
jgi:hypothetical protein